MEETLRREGVAPPDTRERLIEAGTVLFAEKGYGGASVREICARAGTSMNMIHHYFGSKRGLYDAIFERFSAEVFRVPMRIIEAPPQDRDDFTSRFQLFVLETLDAIISQRALYALVTREEIIPEAFVEYSACFVEFLRGGQAKGVVNADLDAEMLSGFVLDRLLNQVLHASWIKRTAGVDVLTDADYKDRWIGANLELFLQGLMA